MHFEKKARIACLTGLQVQSFMSLICFLEQIKRFLEQQPLDKPLFEHKYSDSLKPKFILSTPIPHSIYQAWSFGIVLHLSFTEPTVLQLYEAFVGQDGAFNKTYCTIQNTSIK